MSDGQKGVICVEGEPIATIAKRYGIYYGTIYHRWQKGARTIAELTRQVRSYDAPKKPGWDTPHRFSEGVQYRIPSGHVTVCDIVRKSRTGFLTVCVGKARHRVEIRHRSSYECIIFPGTFGEPIVLVAREEAK